MYICADGHIPQTFNNAAYDVVELATIVVWPAIDPVPSPVYLGACMSE